MNSIGERLTAERNRLGLNQGEMAERGGVQRTAQSNYERGTRMPDAAYLAALAQHGVDVLFIVTGQPTPVPEKDMNLYGDAWEVLDRTLQENKKNMPAEKKRQAAEALFEAVRSGEGSAQSLATLLIKAA
ncbi:MAG: helix-turn-helix transcriptional regulator [Alcaligenaceae bacterium]|nr:helix-turn-helix transcriptional regulator [Alcaligenaceae bacterium]